MIRIASSRLRGSGEMPSACRSRSVSDQTSSSAPSGSSYSPSMPASPAARMRAKARYGLAPESMERSSTRAEDPLLGLYIGHPDQGRAVVAAPADVARRLATAGQPLVGVHPLVGDGGDLGGVLEQPGDEVAGDLGEVVLGAGVVEGVVVALEERHVGVHPRAGVLGERLGHEGGVDALGERDLLHDDLEGHQVVGGGRARRRSAGRSPAGRERPRGGRTPPRCPSAPAW